MGRKGSKDETLLRSISRHPASSCCFFLLVLLFVTAVSFAGSLMGVMVAIEGDATWKDLHTRLMKLPSRAAGIGGYGGTGGTSGQLDALEEDEQQEGPSVSGGGPGKPATEKPKAGLPEPIDIDARTRNHWREITERICPNRERKNCAGIDRSGWTDAEKCVWSELSFAGLHQWSTFKLTTHTAAGVRKEKGGDSWSILLTEAEKGLRCACMHFSYACMHAIDGVGQSLCLMLHACMCPCAEFLPASMMKAMAPTRSRSFSTYPVGAGQGNNARQSTQHGTTTRISPAACSQSHRCYSPQQNHGVHALPCIAFAFCIMGHGLAGSLRGPPTLLAISTHVSWLGLPGHGWIFHGMAMYLAHCTMCNFVLLCGLCGTVQAGTSCARGSSTATATGT